MQRQSFLVKILKEKDKLQELATYLLSSEEQLVVKNVFTALKIS